MPDTEGEYEDGHSKPPAAGTSRRVSPATRGGPRGKNPPALLVAALNKPALATTDGRRCKITEREAIVVQLI